MSYLVMYEPAAKDSPPQCGVAVCLGTDSLSVLSVRALGNENFNVAQLVTYGWSTIRPEPQYRWIEFYFSLQ